MTTHQAHASHYPVSFSVEDAVQAYTQYFGAPKRPIPPDPYSNVTTTHQDIAEAFKGRSLVLKQIVEGLLFNADDEFYTTVALPWSQSDEQNISLKRIEFNISPAGRVPSEGISRLLASSVSQFVGSTVRKGIAFYVEEGFYTTNEGKEMYSRNLLGIAKSVQEAANIDAIYTLLSCKDYLNIWTQRYGQLGLSAFKIIKEEVLNFACICRDGSSRLLLAKEHAASVLKARGVPDNDLLLIVTPGTKAYMTMVPGSKMDYYKVGPDRKLILAKGPEAVTVFGSARVFESKTFTMGDGSTPHQFLSRETQFGETYLMSSPVTACHKEYTRECRDIFIYDQNDDNHSRVPFEKAIKHTYMWTSNGEWCPEVNSMMNDANHSKKWKTPKTDDDYYDDMNNDDDDDDDFDGHSKPFFFSTKDNSGNWVLTKYVANMDKWALGKYLQNLGENLLGKVPCLPNVNESEWNEMIELINCIESQGYHDGFFRGVVEKNLVRSLDSKGGFVGEQTPADMINQWSQKSVILEWKENCFGGLDLPNDSENFMDVLYPPGYANFPGLCTLADECGKKDSHWKMAAEKAAKAVALIKALVNTLNQYCQQSEALKPENRDPWFHKADACTTFFSNVVHTCRDPLFLAVLPTFATGTNIGSDHDTIENHLSIIVKLTNSGYVATEIDALFDKVKVNSEAVFFGALDPRVRAAFVMGEHSFGAYKNLMDVLSKHEDSQNALATFVLQYLHDNNSDDGVNVIRRVILGLNLKKPAEVVKYVSALNAPKTRDKSIQTLSQDLTTMDDRDVNIPGFSKIGISNLGIRELSANLRRNNESEIKTVQDLSRKYNVGFMEDLPSSAIEKDVNDYGVAVTKLKATLSSAYDNKWLKRPEIGANNNASSGSIPSDVLPMAFFRSPLTTSMGFLESVSSQEYAVARPSDPRTGHLQAYRGGEHIIPPEIYSRPNYVVLGADASGLNGQKTVHNLSIFQKHSARIHATKSPGLPVAARSERKRQRDLFEEEVDSDDEHLQGASKFGAIMNLEIKEDWNIRDVKKPKKKGSIEDTQARIPFLHGHDKVFTSLNTPSFLTNFETVNNFPQHLVKACALVGMLCPCDGKQFEHWAKHGVDVPFNIRLWRISIEHMMDTFILMRGGPETGATIYGHSNFAIGYDVASKLIYGNFTFESGAMVWGPKNIEFLENVRPAGYIGGRNCTFIRKDNFDASLEKKKERPSLLATVIPYTECKTPDVMSFIGKLPIPELNTAIDGPNRNTYSTSEYYDRYIWNLSMKGGMDQYCPTDNFFDRANKVNVMALQGAQTNYNHRTCKFDIRIECKGHSGQYGAEPGAAAAWDGHAVSFPQNAKNVTLV